MGADAAGVAAILANPARANPKPADRGWLGWSGDPATLAAGNVPTSGQPYLTKIPISFSGPVSNILLITNAAGATLTAGDNNVGIIDPSGNRQALSTPATVLAAFQGTAGLLTLPLVTPWTPPAGTPFLWVVTLAVGTTMPKFYGTATPPSVLNAGFSPAGYLYGVTGSALTAIPTSITPSALTIPSGGNNIYAAVS